MPWRNENDGLPSSRYEGSLGLVVPVYNEEAILEESIRHINDQACEIFETVHLVVSNDGSTDQSAAILDRLQEEISNMTVVHSDANGGFGAAVRAGFQVCDTEFVMFCPVDYPVTEGDF